MNNNEQKYTSFDEAWIGLPAETIAQRAFKAGWDAHQQLLQQTQCTTLLEELEHKLEVVRMLTFAMDEVTAARHDATESTLLSVIELIKERQPIA